MAEVVGEGLPPRALPGCGPQLLRNFREPGPPLEDEMTAEEIDRMELMLKRVSDYLCERNIRHTLGRGLYHDMEDPWLEIRVEVLAEVGPGEIGRTLRKPIYRMFDETMAKEDHHKFLFILERLRREE